MPQTDYEFQSPLSWGRLPYIGWRPSPAATSRRVSIPSLVGPSSLRWTTGSGRVGDQMTFQSPLSWGRLPYRIQVMPKYVQQNLSFNPLSHGAVFPTNLSTLRYIRWIAVSIPSLVGPSSLHKLGPIRQRPDLREFQSPLSWGRLPYISAVRHSAQAGRRFNPLSRGAVFLTNMIGAGCPRIIRSFNPLSRGAVFLTAEYQDLSDAEYEGFNPLSRGAVFLTKPACACTLYQRIKFQSPLPWGRLPYMTLEFAASLSNEGFSPLSRGAVFLT